MGNSLVMYVLGPVLIVVFVSAWMGNILRDIALGKILARIVAARHTIEIVAIEIFSVDKRDKVLLAGGFIVIAIVSYFTLVEYGLIYAIALPSIAIFSIVLSQKYIHQNIFSKERLDELLKRILIEEKQLKAASDSRLKDIEALCSYVISEFGYDQPNEPISNKLDEKEVQNKVGYEKSKSHLSSLFKEVSSGLLWLGIIVIFLLLSAGVKNIVNENTKSERSQQYKSNEKLLNDMSKAVESNK